MVETVVFIRNIRRRPRLDDFDILAILLLQ